MATISESTSSYPDFLPLHRFSTTEYLEMVDNGVFVGKRVELVGGVIVDMSPAGSRHSQLLGQLNRLLAPLLARTELWIQGTLLVAEGQVYDPDVMLLCRKPGGYRAQLPGPADVLLVIEGSETSFRRDRLVKLPVYASAGIAEYWIADLERLELLIHRNPDGAVYRSVEIRRGDEIVSPLAAPELSFTVAQAFE